jgi:sugar/nucleoside kinase (ribokinase family)
LRRQASKADAVGLDLLVVGDCNPDLLISGAAEATFGQAERIVDDATLVVGGSAAITACGAARLGLSTRLVSIVGDDAFGRFMRESLVERGVDISRVEVDRERSTGVSVIFVHDGDRAILTALGTIPELAAAAIDGESLRTVRHVHVTPLFLLRRLRPGLAKLLAEARASGATTSLDPNWDPEEEWNGGFEEALTEADVFFANGEEVRRIAGTDETEDAARTLAAQGPLVVVKLGSEGALAVAGDEAFRAPALPVDVVDTVGAGDSFNAGFLAGLLTGRSPQESLTLACRCGSLSTRAAGGTAAQPTFAEAAVP